MQSIPTLFLALRVGIMFCFITACTSVPLQFHAKSKAFIALEKNIKTENIEKNPFHFKMSEISDLLEEIAKSRAGVRNIENEPGRRGSARK